MTLTEIVARAIRDIDKRARHAGWTASETEYAVAAVAALSDPPAYVIEAGAKAMHDALPHFNPWDEVDDVTRAICHKAWLDSWRAALNADGTHTRTPA